MTLLVVSVALRLLGLPITPENALIGMAVAAPFLISAMVLAWHRIEPAYRALQVKAMLTSTSGLVALDETGKRKHRD